jgi:hypothetical protein
MIDPDFDFGADLLISTLNSGWCWRQGARGSEHDGVEGWPDGFHVLSQIGFAMLGFVLDVDLS